MAAVQVLPVGPKPTVVLHEIEGHLTITGWDRPELQMWGPQADEIVCQEESSRVEVRAHRNCTMQTPLQTTLHVHQVDGHATINLLLGTIEVESVGGNFAANSIGPFSAGSVDGNLAVHAVAGDFSAASVDGNARVHQVAGNLRLGSVDGNLTISQVVGNVQAQTDGNAELSLNLAHGQHVQVEAEGNIVCRIQPDAGVTVRLAAEGVMRVRNLGEPRQTREGHLEFVLGDGSAELNLRAEGDIVLMGAELHGADFGTAFAGEFGGDISEEMARRAAELGRQIAQQVESQVAVVTREMEDKLLRFADNEEMANKIQDRISATMRRAEEKLAEAMRKMEVRTQEGERRRKGYGWQTPSAPPTPPAPPKRSQASEEERMMVLRMVEQGKLSVDEAEKLLAALNG